MLTSSEKVRTISVAIASLIGEFTTEWNQVMAAAREQHQFVEAAQQFL